MCQYRGSDVTDMLFCVGGRIADVTNSVKMCWLDEITACIGSLKKTLSGQGYKTPKIALAGFSAGGHLALLYSYSRAAESPIPIAFVFEKVGPTDIGPNGFEPKVATGLVTAGSGTKITAEDFNTEKGRRLAASL